MEKRLQRRALRDGSKQLRPKKIRFFSTQEKKNNDEQTWKRSHLKWGTPGPFTCPLSTEAQKSNFHKRTIVFFYDRNFWTFFFFFRRCFSFGSSSRCSHLGNWTLLPRVSCGWDLWWWCGFFGAPVSDCGVVLVPRESVSWVFRHIARLDRDTLSNIGIASR